MNADSYSGGKANVVAGALSRKVSHSAALITQQLAQLSVQPTLKQKIIVAQRNYPYLVEKFHLARIRQVDEFSISFDDGLLFERHLCVLADSVVKIELLIETHSSPFSMHRGSTKMYQDLKRVYWWRNMKREVEEFVSKFLMCQQTRKGFTVIWVVVDRLTKSAHFIPGKSIYPASMWAQLYLSEIVRLSHVCWDEVGEQRLMGSELVQSTNEAVQKIRAHMQAAQSRQKSYADARWKDLEFDVGDKRIGPMAYRLALPPPLFTVHDVFHVSMLRKYVTDPSHVVDYEPLEIDENLSYAEKPVEILARKVKMLRNRGIQLVKVLWRNHKVEEATWKREDDMRSRYPELFEEESFLRRGECNTPSFQGKGIVQGRPIRGKKDT
ncbi:DNA/RNA polymerases superfamily protein [Cucumis melo var. makuwa]|uniref:DNA/RNA polymerases superfamily protein n=1 Tax=Cucumis melo var. makuwa TaxID=1194695 RepID=A0A5A7TVJ8_CUCMM|nr:DNA/RNA polymerases superfamily protein [Cucumis melo var. makuwa]